MTGTAVDGDHCFAKSIKSLDQYPKPHVLRKVRRSSRVTEPSVPVKASHVHVQPFVYRASTSNTSEVARAVTSDRYRTGRAVRHGRRVTKARLSPLRSSPHYLTCYCTLT